MITWKFDCFDTVKFCSSGLLLVCEFVYTFPIWEFLTYTSVQSTNYPRYRVRITHGYHRGSDLLLSSPFPLVSHYLFKPEEALWGGTSQYYILRIPGQPLGRQRLPEHRSTLAQGPGGRGGGSFCYSRLLRLFVFRIHVFPSNFIRLQQPLGCIGSAHARHRLAPREQRHIGPEHTRAAVAHDVVRGVYEPIKALGGGQHLAYSIIDSGYQSLEHTMVFYGHTERD